MSEEEKTIECNRCKKVLTSREENYIMIEVTGSLTEEENLLVLCKECTVDFLITIKNFIKQDLQHLRNKII